MFDENECFEVNPSFNDLNPFIDPMLEIHPFDFLNYEKMPECIPDEALAPSVPLEPKHIDVTPKFELHSSFQIPNFHQSSNLVNRFECNTFPLVKYEKPIEERIRESVDY